MQLTLTPKAEALLNEQMKHGRFQTPGDLIETALLVFRDSTPDDIAALNKLIDEGLRSAEEEPLYSEQEARAYLAAVRAKL